MPATNRFDFAFAPAYRLPALAFGVTPRTTWVDVTESHLHIRFGLWSLRTGRDNVAGVTQSGGYGFLKTAGPAHLSLADHGVTFATNGDEGVCIEFREPVKSLDPTGRLRHPGATVTVADPRGLATALQRR
ncbi:MAG TPA: hypothetical protein VFO98_13605 [Marmoricola sp.]|nr:hypothetical protein [Marmoricola sp.]